VVAWICTHAKPGSGVFNFCIQNCANSTYGIAQQTYPIRSEGNCLPFPLSDIEIAGQFNIDDSSIYALEFINSDTLLVGTSDYKVYMFSISEGSSHKILELEENEHALSLTPITNTTFMLYTPIVDSSFYYYDIKGNLLWEFPWEIFAAPPIVINSNILILTRNRDDETSIVVLDMSGRIIQKINDGIGRFSQFLLCNEGVLVLDENISPNILKRADSGYILEPWIEMDNGIMRNRIFDSAGRLISLENAATVVRILDKSETEPQQYLVWGAELNIEGQIDYPFPDYSMLASNGQVIAILQPNSLLTINHVGELMPWIDNFKTLGIEFIMKDFYIDSLAERFLILDENRIILGGDGFKILEFESRVNTDLVFSPDRELAVVGTSGGNVVLICLS
jgi:hypothetical protein